MKNIFIHPLMQAKKLLKTGLIITVFICFNKAEAKIWTVDNTPGAGADSSNLQGIMNIASSGDTIIVMPSLTTYGYVTFNKKLFIYTRGYTSNNLDKDRSVTVYSVSFSNGSNGSILKGFSMSFLYVSADNSTVQNCNILNSVSLTCNNSILLGCALTSSNFNLSISNTSYNNIISNCYFQSKISSGAYNGPSYPFINGGNSTTLIKNCMFVEVLNGGTISNGGFPFFKDSYAKVYNCIMWSNHPNRTRFDTLNGGSVFKNNLTYSVNTKLPKLPGTGNLNDTLPVFEGGYNSTNNLPFYRANNNMRLASNSPGKNAGTDSTDIGLYGGQFNFSFEGNVPGVAIFDDFEVMNPVLKKGDVLKVKVSARKEE